MVDHTLLKRKIKALLLVTMSSARSAKNGIHFRHHAATVSSAATDDNNPGHPEPPILVVTDMIPA